MLTFNIVLILIYFWEILNMMFETTYHNKKIEKRSIYPKELRFILIITVLIDLEIKHLN